MYPVLSLLFGGGIITKLLVAVSLVGFLYTGTSLIFTKIDLNKAEKQLTTLQQKNQILTDNNAVLKSNLQMALDANKSTVEANEKLLNERKEAQVAVQVLAKKEAKAKADLNAANKKIDDMLKDPKNEGALAPVLRETLKDIQKRKK